MIGAALQGAGRELGDGAGQYLSVRTSGVFEMQRAGELVTLTPKLAAEHEVENIDAITDDRHGLELQRTALDTHLDEGAQDIADAEHHGNAGDIGGGEGDAREVTDLAEQEGGQQRQGDGRGPGEEGLLDVDLSGDGALEQAGRRDARERRVDDAGQQAIGTVEQCVELGDVLMQDEQVVEQGRAEDEAERHGTFDKSNGDAEPETMHDVVATAYVAPLGARKELVRFRHRQRVQ